MPPHFPRSEKYDAAWVEKNSMGPNTLWLMESLCERVELEPGMRVLDLGCGRAISSIFLAQEFDVQVWATDLWIHPSENWPRIRRAGLEDRVFPVYAEARSLPYAHGFFDAIVSVDAYHYFGTDDLYVENVAGFLRVGGQLGIVCPGFKREIDGDIPDYLAESYSKRQWHSFHTPEWWRRHWDKTAAVDVTCAEELPQAWAIWEACAHMEVLGDDRPVVEADGGELLSFSRIVARRSPPAQSAL